MKKLLNIFKPRKIILKLASKGILKIPDETYLKLKYKNRTGKELNLSNPKTYNEKLQWLKLYDRNPQYIKMVDKYEVKKYVAEKIGKEYVIPTIGVWDKFEDINFAELPNQFVLKCTHDSGGIIICKNKKLLNIKKAKKKIRKCLRKNYYYIGREWPYKNVKPRIIVEKYMEDSKNKGILDYKFFCFNGIPQIMYVSENSHHAHQKIAFFDMNFKKLDIKRKDYEEFENIPPKPKNFEKMKNICTQLAKNIPHVRVDLYEIENQVYFSELTFYTGSGFIPFLCEEDDRRIGDMLELPKKNI